MLKDDGFVIYHLHFVTDFSHKDQGRPQRLLLESVIGQNNRNPNYESNDCQAQNRSPLSFKN